MNTRTEVIRKASTCSVPGQGHRAQHEEGAVARAHGGGAHFVSHCQNCIKRGLCTENAGSCYRATWPCIRSF